MADTIAYKCTALTGGAAGALDAIDGALLLDGDFAFVMVGNLNYTYLLDVDSGSAESSPTIISPDVNAGTKRWVLQGSNVVVGSDADGDMYYRASSVLARLAKGAANLKMFMNAGATAPEWAAGLKIGTFSRDMEAATGSVSYTGIGFKPTLVLFFGAVNFIRIAQFVGVSDGTLNYSLTDFGSDGAGTYLVGSVCIDMRSVTSGEHQQATCTMTADGFDLSWTKTATPDAGTATMYYIAIR